VSKPRRHTGCPNAPGKKAEAVADLTLAFLVSLAQGLPKAQRFLDERYQLSDNWAGARFEGGDVRRHVLGLIGYGPIGRRVAQRVLAFGLTCRVRPFGPLPTTSEQIRTARLAGPLRASLTPPNAPAKFA
jgi:phosphoglycerate dehydrogenase-like enzyme